MRYLFLLFMFLSFTTTAPIQQRSHHTFFSQVILWGHTLHSHTHSYIHWGLYRAFQYLGYRVYWFDDQSRIDTIDLAHTLFITEGQVDSAIPKRDDCYYILHNCNADAYKQLRENNRCILLQVYTHDCLPYAQKIDECIFANHAEKMIFMPWATDLLPYEIDAIKEQVVRQEKEKVIYWIGTIGAGVFGNIPEIDPFKKACSENNIMFNHITTISMEDNVTYIQKSYMAPAIQGKYQCEKGYIPCRIFKNISYGQWGITNNKAVYDLFEGKITYNPDTYQLFYDAHRTLATLEISQLYELMDYVKTKHTYINRIETLLCFMEQSLHIQDQPI